MCKSPSLGMDQRMAGQGARTQQQGRHSVRIARLYRPIDSTDMYAATRKLTILSKHALSSFNIQQKHSSFMGLDLSFAID